MSQNRLNWRKLGWPVYLAVALLIGVIALFVVALVAMPRGSDQGIEPLSTTSYRARVDALLAIARPADAEALVVKYGCTACHRDGAANGVAPSWVGVAERAATRRPPMPADAYLYESITHPSAYVVAGYADVMPKDFATRLSDQELADVVAYLLTADAH